MPKLYLNAIEHALPETTLSLGDGEIDGERFSASDRRTALSPKYIEATKNVEPYESREAFLETPTSVAVQAVKKALSEAKISSEEIGLLLGATTTPIETIPTEAQRIGKELGVKIPTYDIQGGGADFALYLETLSSWKVERIPEYSLLTSTHLPTTRINYATGPERFFFGDGAGAAIVSKSSGIFSVEFATAKIDASRSHALSIDLYGHLHCDFQAESDFFIPELAELYRSVKEKVSGDVTFIESQLTSKAHGVLKGLVGGDNWYSSVSKYGNTLGAAPYISLSEIQNELKTEQVVILQSGIGLSVGIVILQREK